MSDDHHQSPARPDRRGFLRSVIAATGGASLAPGVLTGAGFASGAAADQPSIAAGQRPAGAPVATEAAPLSQGYLCFGSDEASFVEALVNTMCPADQLTPNGVDCGLAVFFDRQLAGGFGKGERLYMRGPWKAGKPQHGYQLPLTPEQFFKEGVAAADRVCQQRYGKAFDALEAKDANAFLHDVGSGAATDARIPLASWFNELVYPLFAQACFADPIYGGNAGKVFWKLVGYPGLPATHAQDMLDFRGKPYPGAADPKSIADFS